MTYFYRIDKKSFGDYLFNAKKRTCLPIFLFEILTFQICLLSYAPPVICNLKDLSGLFSFNKNLHIKIVK